MKRRGRLTLVAAVVAASAAGALVATRSGPHAERAVPANAADAATSDRPTSASGQEGLPRAWTLAAAKRAGTPGPLSAKETQELLEFLKQYGQWLREFAPANAARTDCGRYRCAVNVWWARHNNEWPRSLEEVLGKVEPDPWGNPYILVRDGERVRVGSLGPDGQEGTDDDISSASSGGVEGEQKVGAPNASGK